VEKKTQDLDLGEELALHLRLAGVEGVPEQWFAEVEPAQAAAAVSAPPLVGSFSGGSLSGGSSAGGLAELRAQAQGCQACRLCETRQNVVFGVGLESSPRIAFVGEGPGADEDRLGEPFVGKAGELLTAAITKGLGLSREEVYICNVVKCRPPNNRNPLPDEVESCLPYLHGQLEAIKPQVIVTLGAPAQRALSGVDMGITKLRGNWQEWRGIPLMPTFHPAYILRNAEAKRPFWEDLQSVMRKLESESIPMKQINV